MKSQPIPPESPSAPAFSDYEQRLDEAIAGYLEAVHAGQTPDRAELLARHADLADDLRSFFTDEDRLKGLAGSLFSREAHRGHDPSPGSLEPMNPEFEIKAGADFGMFELIEEIATGGMGVVFKARHKQLGRIVALKTIRPAALRPGADAIQRFRIEAEAVARLDHPHIVPIYEMGEHAGFPYISLKLIGGGDLERHIPRLKKNPRASARLMSVVARAVHYAHLRGILHRDLKPSNILLDDHDEPHVTDFGLAKCVEDDSGLTQTGLILGTPSYMAPEQVAGHRGEVTTAADVYGLGAVLYRLLTGRPPFQGDSVYETLRQVKEQEPVHPGIHDPYVDRDLAAICLKCLEKSAGRRYGSAEAMADDLDRWLSGEPIIARPSGQFRRVWRWCGRNRVVAGLSASVAALLVIVAAVATGSAVRQHTLRVAAQTSESLATAAADREHEARLLADASADEIRWRLVRMNVQNGNRIVDQGDLTGALPWFAEALRLDHDDPAAAATHRLRLGTLLNQSPVLDQIFSHEATIQWAAFDPAGRRLATASADHTARIWDVETGAAITRPLRHDGPVNWVEFRSDGARLLSASDDGTIRIWNAADGQPTAAGRFDHQSALRLARFSPDGRRIVSGGFNGTVRLWNAEDGASLGSPQRLKTELFCLAFSPDGRRIAVGAGDGNASVWNVSDDGLRLAGKIGHKATVRDVEFSPDGTRLLIASHSGSARVWDIKTGTAVTAELRHGKWVFHAEFSPDGRRVVTASHDGTARVWDARTGRPITPASGSMEHAIAARHACFSPDGARVVTCGYDGIARVWDASTGEPLSAPLFHGGPLLLTRFTADGSRVLTVGSDSTARLWDVTPTGSSAVTIEHGNGVNQAAFEPGGKRFATACADGSARVWDTMTGRPVTPIMSHRRGVLRVAFRGDGRLLATGSFDGTARIWDASTGLAVTPPLVHKDTVICVAFSTDGSRLATSSADGTARIWDVATGQPVTPSLEHKGEVYRVVYSPDGRMLASASKDGTACIWDAATGSLRFPPFNHDTEVSCVSFHPAGRFLLTACSDNSLAERAAQQWDIATGKAVGPPLKHGDGVLWAVYSPDGTRIATASEDMTARIWDAATGSPTTRPLPHRHWVNSLEFSPDGRMLATCSGDGTARVWEVETGEPLSAPLLHRDQTNVVSAKFRPDGRAILTAGLDGTARRWDLPVDDRPVGALITEAQVRGGRRIDHTGGQIPLSDVELVTAWTELHGNTPARPGPLSRSLADWHRREVRRLLVVRNGAAAAWHLDRLAQAEPADSSIADRLAAAYEMAADWSNVEHAASRAIAAGSGDVDILVRRGWARIHLGNNAQAAVDFRQALKREPKSAAFRLGLFLTLAERRELTDANALWRLVMDDHDEPLTERWDAIATHLSVLTENRPKSWWFWRARGHVRMRAGRPELAEADYSKAIEVRPDDGWSWLGRGLARKNRGQKEPALGDLTRSVALEPNVPSAWAMRGEILGSLLRWEEAAEAYDRWAALGGDPGAIPWYYHAVLRLYTDDHPGYRHACQAMMDRFGTTTDPFVASLLAHACSLGTDSGVDLDRVIDLAGRAVRGTPRDGWAIYTVGAALRRAGRLEEAIASFDQAARIDPGWAGAPLIPALRLLTERALTIQPKHDHRPGPVTTNHQVSDLDSSKLTKEIRRTNGAWQYQVEAVLLGRELEGGRASAKSDD